MDSGHLIKEPALSNFARADASLDAQVEQFRKIETSEALTNSLPQFSVNDERAVDIWERSVEVIEGQYQLHIPFKSMLPNLPDNRRVDEKRLKSLAYLFRTRQVQGCNSRVT